MTMLRIGVFLTLFVILGLSFIYGVLDPMAQRCDLAAEVTRGTICPRYVDLGVSLILIISAIIALFGTLSIDGAQNPDGTYREQRIRLSIATTMLIVYLMYFGMAIMWRGEQPGQGVLTTFTDLMMVVIPFYFASSAVVEYSGKKNKAETPGQSPAA
jgi:hypothetical protein